MMPVMLAAHTDKHLQQYPHFLYTAVTIREYCGVQTLLFYHCHNPIS